MKKNTGVVSMEELQKISLVNNLKLKIEELKDVIKNQASIIEQYKRSTKTTLINEQEIQIQKLNDENKRLLLVIEELKEHGRRQTKREKKLMKKESRERELKKKNTEIDEFNIENIEKGEKLMQSKCFHILMENELLKKKLLTLKANQNKASKNTINDRSSIMIEKNINEADRLKQKNYELEAQLSSCQERQKKLQKRVEDLEALLEKAMQISVSMKILS